MKQDIIEKRLKSMLPDRLDDISLHNPNSGQQVEQVAKSIKVKQDLKELAKLKYEEKKKLKAQIEKKEKLEATAKSLGVDLDVTPGQTEHQIRAIAEQQKKIEAIEAIEAEATNALDVVNVSENKKVYSGTTTKALQLQGPSRPEITKLLTALNINLSVQLSKQDTANLLACLLTCNEAQLAALYNNKKIPIVIKTVIKRLQEDLKLGNIDTIEKLWDRVFGKGQMTLNLPEQQQLQTGIIPNMPISREAYIVIRDTLIK